MSTACLNVFMCTVLSMTTIRLCDAWSEDLMHCREYLAEKVGGGGNPKEKIAQGEWLMLVSLRDDVLKLKQETELPGASTNWKQEPGFESHHVPVLFLDDNNLTRNFTVGCHGNNDESMRELTITKQDGSRVRCQYKTYILSTFNT